MRNKPYLIDISTEERLDEIENSLVRIEKLLNEFLENKFPPSFLVGSDRQDWDSLSMPSEDLQ